jgi:hypothetical protein
MFLSAALVLTLSRMTWLRELVIPSYHPFLFSSVKDTTWSELKSVEFGNVALEEEEASDMVAWLAGMVGLEKLLFPLLAEKADNVCPVRTGTSITGRERTIIHRRDGAARGLGVEAEVAEG